MYARMKKSLPELYAFTICMWLKSKALAGLGTPFSYSVPSQANEIVLLEWGTNPLELLINDKVSPAGGGTGGKPPALISLSSTLLGNDAPGGSGVGELGGRGPGEGGRQEDEEDGEDGSLGWVLRGRSSAFRCL